jgi:serine/threonine protein kinase
MNPGHLCMGCMGIKGDAQFCGDCGWKDGTPSEPLQLQPRTVLDRRYLLGRVLGQGGFGITYLGWDLNLNRKLAVKEYFPREVCSRGKDQETVQPLSQRNREAFQYALKKFLDEGRALARFQDHPNVVSMLDYFEGNGTAYIVMAYMDGLTFKQYLEEQGGKIPFDAALNILIFVMDALREVHKAGMLHRDISPDNIYLNKNRQVKILDFGATRYAMREQVQGLTVLFKPGYAPIEQYSSGGKQGPWTDVYALGATFYRAITGQVPTEAPDRLAHDSLVPPSRLGVSIPEKSELALLKALAVHAENRFQTVGDFQSGVLPRKSERPRPAQREPRPTKSIPPWLLVTACLLFLATLGSSALWYSARGQLKSARATIEGAETAIEPRKARRG